MALPDYLQDTAKDFAKQLTATTSVPIDTTKFTGRQFVGGEDPLQTQAIGIAQQGVGSYQPFLTAAQQAGVSGATTLGTAATALGGAQPMLTAAQGLAPTTGAQATAQAQDFMSPFQQQVIDTSLQALERERAAGRQRIADDAVRAGAFGGARMGVERGVYDAETAAQLARLEADLRSEGFQRAQDQAAQAFTQQTDLARLQPELARGLQTALSGFGTTSQVQQQQVLDAERMNRQRQEEAFRNQLEDFRNLFATLKTGVGGQTTQDFEPAPSRLQGILGAGTMLGSVLGGLGSILGQ